MYLQLFVFILSLSLSFLLLLLSPILSLSLFPSLPSSSSPQMVVSNLSQYHDQLVSGVPLFTVETLLSAPEIVLHPHANELVKMLMAAMREVVER